MCLVAAAVERDKSSECLCATKSPQSARWCSGGGKGQGQTYDGTSKQEQRSERIHRERNDSPQSADHAPCQPDEGSDEPQDARKDLIVCDRRCATIDLLRDKVGAEGEDDDGAEELGMLGACGWNFRGRELTSKPRRA